MEQLSIIIVFVVFPFIFSGYVNYEFWRTPENYHARIKAFYGEDSWATQVFTSRFVILICRIVALIVFIVTGIFLAIFVSRWFLGMVFS